MLGRDRAVLRLQAAGQAVQTYARALGKWILLAGVTGVLCGALGSAFHHAVELVTSAREAHAWLLWLLPVAGLAVVAIYRLLKVEGVGTNDVIDEVHLGKGLPLTLLPAIFSATVLTHLFGGSAGREGAALQMGGTVGYHVGRLLRLDDRDLRTATMTGMAAFFTALFGTPLAATIFAMMVISVGVFYHADFLPCLVGSLVAFGVSLLLGVEPTRFVLTAPDLSAGMLLRVAGLGALCGLTASLFCHSMHIAERLLKRLLPNPWLRALAGGAAVVLLTLAVGAQTYNGAGMGVIRAAIEGGTAPTLGFLFKILFTAITLGAGFKGGEVVPSFFVGATFGCVVGPLLGIPAEFSAALGLSAVFCGATNCPVASIFLSMEMFGGQGLLFFALACGLSYLFSGYSGLYSSQKILYSKLEARFINIHTNSTPPPIATSAEGDSSNDSASEKGAK
ncbi:MAG: chloride channel protein [Candidatus Spyradocola sp.]